MLNDRRSHIINNLRSKETEDLLEIWQNGDVDEWDEQRFEIVREILLERLGYVPPQSMEKQVAQVFTIVEGYLQAGEFEKALEECNRVIQMAPELAGGYHYRGQVYDEMGQLEKAIADFQAAIQRDPEWKDAWDSMSGIEKDLEEAFQQSPAKRHLDQALEYVYHDEPEKALEEIELTRDAMPNIAIAHNYLGMILEELEQLEPAIESYLRAIQLNPRFYAARENLANARVRREAEEYPKDDIDEEIETQEEFETNSDLDEAEDSESLANETPVPGWLYMDEKAYHLSGWAGHRTRPGRSGYDPLDTDFEEAHVEGTIIRLCYSRKFRTRNPIYLALMTFIGMVYCLPLLVFGLAGHFPEVMIIVITIPAWVAGIGLLMNVYLSLRLINSDEYGENGEIFF